MPMTHNEYVLQKLYNTSKNDWGSNGFNLKLPTHLASVMLSLFKLSAEKYQDFKHLWNSKIEMDRLKLLKHKSDIHCFTISSSKAQIP